MALRSMVGKAVLRERTDGGRAPTINQLLLPKGQRTLPRDVETWLETHDPLALLESLAVHLIRSQPENEVEEAEKWFEGQHGRKGGAASAVLETEVALAALTRTLGCLDPSGRKWVAPGVTEYLGNWANRSVVAISVSKDPPPGATAAEAKAHHHRLACISATAPFLAAVRHEALIPTFGFVQGANSFTTLHPMLPSPLKAFLMARKRRLSGLEVVRVGLDVASALTHLHTLGFLHRDISCSTIYPRVVMNAAADDASIADDDIMHAQLGGYAFAVRTTRGRVAMTSWLPLTHAPETPHTRFFDWGTDVYGLGLALLEMCFYGNQQAALAAAASVSDNRKPAAVPKIIWDSLITPSLSPLSDARITAAALRRAAESVEATYVSGGDAGMDFIPFPSDEVDSATLSSLQRAGAPPTAIKDEAVVCSRLASLGFAELIKALERNANLRSIHLSESVVDPAGLVFHPSASVSAIHLTRCTLTSSLAEALPRCASKSLQELRVDQCVMGDAEATAVVIAAAQMRCLRVLGMARVGGSRDFGTALLDQYQQGNFHTVTTLCIGGNSIPATILSQLAAHWFQHSAVVEELDFSHTKDLDYFSVGNLAQVVRTAPALRRLDLSDVAVSSPGLWLLLSALKSLTGERPIIAISETLDHAYADEIRKLNAAVKDVVSDRQAT